MSEAATTLAKDMEGKFGPHQPAPSCDNQTESPYKHITMTTDTYAPIGNEYYRTWDMQGHMTSGNNNQEGDYPPPYPQAHGGGSGTNRHSSDSSRYVYHVYESPNFERRDLPGERTEYFELDPDAMPESSLRRPPLV